MKTVWKWVLGILGVLIIAGLVAGAVFAWQHGFTLGMRRAPFAYRQYQQNVPNSPQNNQGNPNVPNRPFPGHGYGYGPMMGGGPMMMGGRGFDHYGMFMPFGPFGMMGFMFFGLIRLIVPLGILVLVAYIFYQMGKRAGMSAIVPPAAVSAPAAPVQTEASGKTNRSRKAG